jgi:hypothetical protein
MLSSMPSCEKGKLQVIYNSMKSLSAVKKIKKIIDLTTVSYGRAGWKRAIWGY